MNDEFAVNYKYRRAIKVIIFRKNECFGELKFQKRTPQYKCVFLTLISFIFPQIVSLHLQTIDVKEV
jgi:hypothetical protein